MEGERPLHVDVLEVCSAQGWWPGLDEVHQEWGLAVLGLVVQLRICSRIEPLSASYSRVVKRDQGRLQ